MSNLVWACVFWKVPFSEWLKGTPRGFHRRLPSKGRQQSQRLWKTRTLTYGEPRLLEEGSAPSPTWFQCSRFYFPPPSSPCGCGVVLGWSGYPPTSQHGSAQTPVERRLSAWRGPFLHFHVSCWEGQGCGALSTKPTARAFRSCSSRSLMASGASRATKQLGCHDCTRASHIWAGCLNWLTRKLHYKTCSPFGGESG